MPERHRRTPLPVKKPTALKVTDLGLGLEPHSPSIRGLHVPPSLGRLQQV